MRLEGVSDCSKTMKYGIIYHMRAWLRVVSVGGLLAFVGCSTSSIPMNRTMGKVGYRRATRAELLAPIKPTFSIPKLGPAEPARPRSDLVGKWQATYVTDGRQDYLTSGYIGPITTVQGTYTYQFFTDGIFTLVSHDEKAGPMSGHETSWNGKWSYADGMLTCEMESPRTTMSLRMFWHGTDTLVMRKDVEEMKQLVKEQGSHAQEFDCYYDSDGLLRMNEVFFMQGERVSLSTVERPQVFKRIGEVDPE